MEKGSKIDTDKILVSIYFFILFFYFTDSPPVGTYNQKSEFEIKPGNLSNNRPGMVTFGIGWKYF